MQLPPIAFEKWTLPNGLDLILRTQRGLPIVSVNLWYRVGSKNEERNQRGFAHLFEHLMFEGSVHFPGDFFKHLQPLGASINGSTSSDRTNYFVDIPAAHLELVLAMESDRMANLVPALNEEKLRIQKDVVRNEYRQNYLNRPYGKVWQLLAEALYPPTHPYSWLTIGAMEDLESASLQDVAAFFQRYYVPANASLAIVGDVDPDTTRGLVESYFGSIPGGARALRPWSPPLAERHHELELRDNVELDRLYQVWSSVPHFEPDDAPLQLIADLLARGRASRLYQKLVVQRRIAQDVTAFQSGRELGGSFGIVVTLRPAETIAHARELVEEELAALAAEGCLEEELKRVQTMKTAAFLFALEHLGGFGGIADRLNAYNVFRGDPSLISSDLARYLEVDVSRIRETAARLLGRRPTVRLSVLGRKTSLVSVAPDRSKPPAPREPVPYQAPIPTVLRLGNGIPLWVLPARELPTVALAIAIRGGGGIQPADQPGLARLVTSMLDEGTVRRSAAEIAQAAEAMGSSLSASCDWDGSYVSLRCMRGFLEDTLDLAVEILRQPSFPESEWARIRAQTRIALRAERDSAEARAYRGFLQQLYLPGHPYRFPLDGDEAAIAQVDRNDLVSFHRRHFGPVHAAVVIAGDVDPEVAAKLIEKRLADWTGQDYAIPAISAPPPRIRPKIVLLNRPGAAQSVIRIGHVGIARNDAAYDHALLMNQVLGGQFTSRLNEKLREQLGFTYGVRSQLDCRMGPGPLSIATSVQTDRLAEALEEIVHECQALLGERPPTELEFEHARRALIEGQSRHFETPGALVNRFAHLLIHRLPPDHHAGFPARIQAISRRDLTQVIPHLLHPQALVASVVTNVEEVGPSLERIDWADLEVVDDDAETNEPRRQPT
jgi:zinc protease